MVFLSIEYYQRYTDHKTLVRFQVSRFQAALDFRPIRLRYYANTSFRFWRVAL